MFQDSLNQILGSIYQAGAVGKYLKQQTPISTAAERELEEYKKAEEKERKRQEREREVGTQELRDRGYTPEEIERYAGDDELMANELFHLYRMDEFAERIATRTFDPAEATVPEFEFMRLMRRREGQAALHLAAEYDSQQGLERSLEEQRNVARRNQQGGNR